MNRARTLFLSLFVLGAFQLPGIALGEAKPPSFPSITPSPSPSAGCIPGVLIKCANPNMTFTQYLSSLLKDNMAYVILIAIVLIVASGIQYMVNGGNTAELTKAKQRILGILGGVIFYFLIQSLLPLIASNLKI